MKKHVKILYLCLAFSFALGIVPFYGLAQDAGLSVLQPEQKTTAAGVKTSVGSNNNTAPKTADTKPLLHFALLGVISAVTICVAGHRRKKSQR